MAKYRVSHDIDRTWICRDPDGKYTWGLLKDAVLFPNYRTAKAALDSMPDEKRMYNELYRKRCYFMKFYDSVEDMRREDEYKANKRLLESWGY